MKVQLAIAAAALLGAAACQASPGHPVSYVEAPSPVPPASPSPSPSPEVSYPGTDDDGADTGVVTDPNAFAYGQELGRQLAAEQLPYDPVRDCRASAVQRYPASPGDQVTFTQGCVTALTSLTGLG